MSAVELPLSNGGVTIVDEDIAEKLKNKRIFRHDKRGYVSLYEKNKKIFLHRFIMNPKKGLVIDHINGQRADNRRANLRVCTQSQNCLNKRKSYNLKSGYRGVYYRENRKTYVTKMKIERKICMFAYYRSRHIAGIFFDQILVNVVGPFVKKNFQVKLSSTCLQEFLDNTNGRIFKVVFSRRKDGIQREMVCRTGVKVNQSGGTLLFNPISKNLFSVYDVQKKSYRFIPLENVICIRFAKTNYRVVA